MLMCLGVFVASPVGMFTFVACLGDEDTENPSQTFFIFATMRYDEPKDCPKLNVPAAWSKSSEIASKSEVDTVSWRTR